MIRAEVFLSQLAQRGVDIITGVPCSYLTPLINTVINSDTVRYLPAANEGDAVAAAAGAELGGRHALVMFQNSGLGNAVNPLTSLNEPFGLPVLILTTWRGQPGKPRDEPQHKVMGEITPGLIELMGIPWESFPEEEALLGPALDRALEHGRSAREPYAFILSKGIIEGDKSPSPAAERALPSLAGLPALVGSQPVHDPDETLRCIQAAVRPTDAVIATTGFTGRALYAQEDRPSQLYMVGSMGCASSMGQGLATVQPQRRVLVLDGDGALLMRMGALASIGHEGTPNLMHIVLDNGVHDSTGSQPTVSPFIDIPAVAAACGYRRVVRVYGLEDLDTILRDPVDELTLVHVLTQPRADRKLPRPTMTPAEVVDRFRAWLAATA
jgi:phosphonopyruvate decarboxylase